MENRQQEMIEKRMGRWYDGAMTLTLIALSALAFACTMAGGLFALKFKDKSHLIIGFSAGAVIGVALFDLLPESFDLGTATGTETMLFVAAGFLLYLVIDRIYTLHDHSHEHEDNAKEHEHRGTLRATLLSLHSFLDGAAIGFSFHISPALGAVVAIAVLAHDFSDGINTVSAIMKSGDRSRALRFLFLDAAAPVLGIIATTVITISENTLAIILALFAGFFLYIGASDLVPESYHAHPTKWTTAMTVVGALVIYFAIHFAG